MYRVLIVDDEKYTVDGLYEMLHEIDHIELDIYKAYSAKQALQWLDRTKIDIVLCDIQMPGMNGLELQRVINAHWPYCKIIFLTGINDFNTSQAAFRGGSVDYILKTEGDEEIVKALEKTVASLSEHFRNEQILLKAAEQLSAAIPALQKEFLTSLLENEEAALRLKQEDFDQAYIPLSAGMPVVIVLGRVDRFSPHLNTSERTIQLYAIRNIAKEYLSGLQLAAVILDEARFAWFIQPEEAGEEPDRARCIRFIHGTMESIQRTCRELLQLPVSLILGDSFAAWPNVALTFKHLEKLLIVGMGHGGEMLLTTQTPDKAPAGAEPARTKPDLRGKPFYPETLHALLAQEQEKDFLRVVDDYIGMDKVLSYNHHDYLEAYYGMSTTFLSYINQWELAGRIAGDIDVDKLMNLQAHPSKEEALTYLRFAAKVLFKQKKDEQAQRTNKVIDQINQYLMSNLGKDLSLARLSEVAYLNPSYLSRLYKQHTGINLSEAIIDLKIAKARELLANPVYKIHEIGAMLGFENAGYFTRFFKKNMGMAPQEFRDRGNR
ncbi:response regulator [Paenibacillus spongiae]|uniref:Response regulator n=1 Tax=Paenibacillus spongiae TaxID=2909671 RepID=A0ABY5S698_9BACL|nr:response regulator [Paenibacillus spongiae]UVI29439.1 response regulator [Paenibacillus spongiae]